jgi:hypothetical protein
MVMRMRACLSNRSAQRTRLARELQVALQHMLAQLTGAPGTRLANANTLARFGLGKLCANE